MSEYLIRKANTRDFPFLADVIVEAEKGITDRLSYTTLFNLPESEVKKLIIAMLEEEIDGCELSLSSFIVTEYDGQPISGSGTWIEAFEGSLPSITLKLNLINYTFEKENIGFLQTKAPVIKDVLIERKPMNFQLEYFHILNEHPGKWLDSELMNRI